MWLCLHICLEGNVENRRDCLADWSALKDCYSLICFFFFTLPFWLAQLWFWLLSFSASSKLLTLGLPSDLFLFPFNPPACSSFSWSSHRQVVSSPADPYSVAIYPGIIKCSQSRWSTGKWCCRAVEEKWKPSHWDRWGEDLFFLLDHSGLALLNCISAATGGHRFQCEKCCDRWGKKTTAQVLTLTVSHFTNSCKLAKAEMMVFFMVHFLGGEE